MCAFKKDFRSKEGLYNLINSGSSDIDSDDSSERPSKRQKSNIKGQVSFSIYGISFLTAPSFKKDLFSAHVFRDPVATTLFYKFISSLYKLSVSDEVKPTPTHQFISKLARRGKLVRCYTQNIDCLEDDVGLTQALDLHNSSAGSVSSNGSASKRFNGHCVQLHGRIDRVKCGCGYVGDWTGEVLEEMSEGYAPSCPGCDERGRLQHAKYPLACSSSYSRR
jgi:NAD-dependent SIR2 family protein deacetylase